MIVGAKGGKEQLVLNRSTTSASPSRTFLTRTTWNSSTRRARPAAAESFAVEASEAALARRPSCCRWRAAAAGGVALSVAASRLGQSLRARHRDRADYPPVELGRHGKYGQMTELAIPLCLGDYYGRFRVVGTTPALFDDLVYDIENNRKFEFAQGRNFEWRSKEHGYFEAVVGARRPRDQPQRSSA